MPTAGKTKLDAINHILRTAYNMKPVSAVDSTGTWPALAYGSSDAAEAERVLDTVTADTLGDFWGGEHVDYHRSYTTTAGGQLDLSGSGENILKVRGNGDLTGRKLTIRAGFLYDQVLNSSSVFGNAQTIYLDVMLNIEFDDLSVNVRKHCLDRAVYEAALARAKDVDDIKLQALFNAVQNSARHIMMVDPYKIDPMGYIAPQFVRGQG